MFLFILLNFVKVTEIYSRLSSGWYIISMLIDLIMLISFFLMVFRNPGFIGQTDETFQSLLESNEPELLCPECEVKRTQRSIHCVICGKCVDVYDHHCPWVDNCIGVNNHLNFMAFIISVFVSMSNSSL